MAKNPLVAQSKQTTKSFASLVKAFAKTVAKGKGSAAFVLGYMDASTGGPTSMNAIPESSFKAYSDGYEAARTPKRKKS
jgi:hypothetical protein